jgi:hypothetical protein
MARGRVPRVTLVAVVALVGLVAWLIFQALSPPAPPDVAAQANAPGTRTADQRAGAQQDSQLTQLRAQTPWADQLGRSVVDLCVTRLISGAVGSWGSWSPVSCQRTTTVYLAFDSDVQQRLAELDRTIGTLGWLPPQAPQQPGLLAQDRYLHQPPDGADPTQSAQAEARPTDLAMYYVSRQAATAGLSVGVNPAPVVPILPGNWDDWPGSHSPDARPYQNDELNRAVYFTWQPVNAPDLGRATAHRYIAAFAFRTTYYTQPQPAPTPTAPEPPDQSACYSGSGTCN